MDLTILGSGTSAGIPVIGCQCPVCTSTDPRNRRSRASALLRAQGHHILFDTSTDLREQCLKNKIYHIDAILFTHAHADHVNGLDEVRAFNLLQKTSIPAYANSETARRVQTFFKHIFDPTMYSGGGKTQILLNVVEKDPFMIGGLQVIPIPLEHGSAEVTGYRIGHFAYLTDCKRIPEESLQRLHGVTHMVLDCLRYKEHPTHMCLAEALAVVQILKPQQVYFTHMTHDIDHHTLTQELPPGVQLGYDGMNVTF